MTSLRHNPKNMKPKLFLFIIFLLTAILPVGVAASTPDEPDADSPYMKKVDEAEAACKDGKWKDAAKALEEALKLDPYNPTNVLIMSNLGLIRFNMGQDSLAVATLTEAHNIAPASVTILNNRARVYSALGMEQDAFADYSHIISLDSMMVSPRMHHCLLALRAHNFRAAKEDFEFMERNYPDDPSTAIAGASFLYGTGEYKAAIPYYTRVLENDKEPEYYGARGYCHLMAGHIQEAADDINTAISMSPDDGELYLYRAVLNKMRYRPDDAEDDARRAVDLGVDRKRARQFIDRN